MNPMNDENATKGDAAFNIGQANLFDFVNVGFPDDFPEQNLPPNFRPPKGERPPRPPMPGTRPLIFEEDMPLDEMSPLMDRVFSIDEYNEQYLETIINLLNDEFELEKMMERIAELEVFLLEENEKRGFWNSTELFQFAQGVDELSNFVEQRHAYLWPLLREEKTSS